MAQIETWVKQDLKKPVKVQYLGGNLFSQDAQANLIGVELTSDGNDYSGGGSVNATVIRADGGTVTVAGSLSGKRASVILPAACYAVIGVITIIIKLSTGSDITTVGAFVSSVYASSTGAIVDPGTVIPSIEDLIDAIEDAVDSIPADYSSLWTTLAPAYSTSATYRIGQYCTRSGVVYRCIANINSGESWTAAHWLEVNVGNEMYNRITTDQRLEADIIEANDLTFKRYNWNVSFMYGRYIGSGYYDGLLNYVRSIDKIPAGKYKVRVPSGFSFLPVVYSSKSEGTPVWNSFSTSTQQFTTTGEWYLNCMKTDTSNPNITAAQLNTLEAGLILTRVSEEESLESKMDMVLIGNKSENLFNGTFVSGEEVATSNGTFVTNASFARTNKIKIKSGYTYIGITTLTEPSTVFIHLAFYDRNGNFISGMPYTGVTVYNANDLYYQRVTAPDDGYVAFDIYASSAGNYNYYLSQTLPTGYKPYNQSTYEINPALVEGNGEVLSSMTYGKTPGQAKKTSFTNGQTLVVETNSIMKAQRIVFTAKVTTMDKLLIGHGLADYGYYLKIDGTNVTYMSNGSSGAEIPHGLTISGFLTVIYEIDADFENNSSDKKLRHTYMIITAGGSFNRTSLINCSTKGDVFAKSDGSTFANAVLTWDCDDYKTPIWAFGDSYFTIYAPSRWPYYMCEWGFNNILYNAYPGEASATAYADLIAALEHGTPKYLVWALGMNDADDGTDPDATWLAKVEAIKTICNEKGITLILCTIPQVTASGYENQYKNAYIKDSNNGFRYIDFAGAVSGVTGWLDNDGIHPNEMGGRLLAMKAITDCPELMQK